MNIFHKHKFKKEDNILYCECGKYIQIPCSHKLKKIERGDVKCCGNSQIQEIYQCEHCGKIQIVNITTGVIEKSIDDN